MSGTLRVSLAGRSEPAELALRQSDWKFRSDLQGALHVQGSSLSEQQREAAVAFGGRLGH